jgi:hypothetical protein
MGGGSSDAVRAIDEIKMGIWRLEQLPIKL